MSSPSEPPADRTPIPGTTRLTGRPGRVDPTLSRETLEAARRVVQGVRPRLGPRGAPSPGEREGYTCLFEGPPDADKALAAAAVGTELGAPVYRVDLSGMVSKYIGETEKNLARLFDRAESEGAILFFDEADDLFGKRTAVKDAHDRYANLEVSYLLQRIERYRGLVILATNRKSDLDPDLLRRLGSVADFALPSDRPPGGGTSG